jgi:hypothetical protein
MSFSVGASGGWVILRPRRHWPALLRSTSTSPLEVSLTRLTALVVRDRLLAEPAWQGQDGPLRST